ncbi:MAG: hypothetical protein ACLKAK_06885 [Alkaliphilus sp.]
MKRIISLILVFSMIFGTTVVFAGNSRTISRTEQMKYEQALLSVEKQFAGQSEAFRESIKSAITESYLRRISNQKHLGVVGEGETKTSFGVLSSNPFMSYNYTASVSTMVRGTMLLGRASDTVMGLSLLSKFTLPLFAITLGYGVYFDNRIYTISQFETGTIFRGEVRMYWTDEANFEYRGIHEGAFISPMGSAFSNSRSTWFGDFHE